MNERIKQLAEQAGVKMNAYGRPIPASLASNFDEFAELIVRECAEFVSNDRQNDDYGVFVANRIKEHFGVEEQVQDSKELHTCPYREEIHNDYESLCDCDEEQQHQCAMDI